MLYKVSNFDWQNIFIFLRMHLNTFLLVLPFHPLLKLHKNAKGPFLRMYRNHSLPKLSLFLCVDEEISGDTLL